MDIFLLPMLNVTLFPRTTKPLSIFEPRHIEMFRESVRTETPVAIGFNDKPELTGSVQVGRRVEFVREIAGYGTTQIVEERTNGTLLIFLHGQGKVRLGPLKESDLPFMVCEAEVVNEQNQVDPGLEIQIKSLNSILARWIQTHIPDMAQRDVFLKGLTGPVEIVGAFSSYLIKDYDFQQMILELNDINEKIYYLHRLAESSEIMV